MAALAAAPDERWASSCSWRWPTPIAARRSSTSRSTESRAAQADSSRRSAMTPSCSSASPAQIHYIDASDEASWIPIADRAMALAEKLGERGAQGRIYHIRADRDFTKGEYAAAVRSLELAVTSLRAAGARRGDARCRARSPAWAARVARTDCPNARSTPTARRWPSRRRRATASASCRPGTRWAWPGATWSGPDKALECYRNGLAEARRAGRPERGAVHGGRGRRRRCCALGKAAEAIPIFEGILAKNPEPYIARFRLGGARRRVPRGRPGQPTR